MTVADIARDVALIIGDDELTAVLSDDGEGIMPSSAVRPHDGDVVTLVKCINMAAAETRTDFPAVVTETVYSNGGVIALAELSDIPITVRGVTANGAPVGFVFDCNGLRIFHVGYCKISYTKAIDDAPLDGELIVGMGVDREMLVYLAARNYSIVVGRPDEASVWDQRYNDEAAKKRLLRRAKVKPRPFLS